MSCQTLDVEIGVRPGKMQPGQCSFDAGQDQGASPVN